jgi:hypothetical protein
MQQSPQPCLTIRPEHWMKVPTMSSNAYQYAYSSFNPVEKSGGSLEGRPHLVRPVPRLAPPSSCGAAKHDRGNGSVSITSTDRAPFAMVADLNSSPFMRMPPNGESSPPYCLQMKKYPCKGAGTHEDNFPLDKFQNELISHTTESSKFVPWYQDFPGNIDQDSSLKTTNDSSAHSTPHSKRSYIDHSFAPPVLHRSPYFEIELESKNIPLNIMLPRF